MTNYITKSIKNGVEANIPVTSVNWNYGDVTVQETLVSWTNIKTVNWTSLLGSGNIAIAWWHDYSRVTKSWTSIQLSLRTLVNPTANFTLTKPSSIEDWMEYVIRCVNTTSYTMTLGSWFTNPRKVSTVLSADASDQFVFVAINGELELQAEVQIAS